MITERQQRAAQAAMDCQDACNPGGVSRLLHEAIAAEIETIGTVPAIGKSPAARLLLSKLADLLHWSDPYDITGGSFREDWDACETIAKGG